MERFRNGTFIIVVFMALACLLSHNALAACIGKTPVWGTGDDRISCQDKQQLKRQEQQLKIQKKRQDLANEKQRLRNNQGIASGDGNTNVILGGLSDIINGTQRNEDADHASVEISQHQVRVELMPYVIPGAYQFDTPGMPERFFINGLAWEYYVNRNLGFGFLWQEWNKTGGQSFDPVMAQQRDGSGDTAIFFPGDVERISYRSLMPYVTINAQLGSPEWVAIGRVGVGPTQAKIEYKSLNTTAHPYADQPADETYQDMASIMFDLAIEKWTEGGTRLGFALRYINARYETTNYLEYVNMSSAQVVFYVQFMLRPLGLL
jgi:hypothetical protein